MDSDDLHRRLDGWGWERMDEELIKAVKLNVQVAFKLCDKFEGNPNGRWGLVY